MVSVPALPGMTQNPPRVSDLDFGLWVAVDEPRAVYKIKDFSTTVARIIEDEHGYETFFKYTFVYCDQVTFFLPFSRDSVRSYHIRRQYLSPPTILTISRAKLQAGRPFLGAGM